MESDELWDPLLIPFIEDLSNSVNYESPGFPYMSGHAISKATLSRRDPDLEASQIVVPVFGTPQQLAIYESQNPVVDQHDCEDVHRRRVSFSPSQGSTDYEGDGEEVINAKETIESTAAYEKRTLDLDTLCSLLGRICRSKGQWLKAIPPVCPIERQNFATPEALALWKVIAEDIFVPHHEEDCEPTTAPNVGIRLMASMWDDLVHMIFADLFKRRPNQELPKPTVENRSIDIEPHDWVAERLIRRYQIFESLPLHPARHRSHCLRVYELAAAAVELRDTLKALNDPKTGDPSNVYEIYSPLRQNSSDVRFSLLRNQNRRIAHLATRNPVECDLDNDSVIPDANADDNALTSDLLAMTLCGGLVRRPRKTMRDCQGRMMRMRKRAVYERKASVATVSPQCMEQTKIRHFIEGSNDDILLHQNRLLAGVLAQYIQGSRHNVWTSR